MCVPTCGAGGDADCPSPTACKGGLCFPSCDRLPSLCRPEQSWVGGFTCLSPEGADEGTMCNPLVGAAELAHPDPSLALTNLTPDEQTQLCDWSAARLGDYGCVKSCSGRLTARATGSRAECVQRLAQATCTATVGDVVACLASDAGDPCSTSILTAPQCEAYRGCL